MLAPGLSLNISTSHASAYFNPTPGATPDGLTSLMPLSPLVENLPSQSYFMFSMAFTCNSIPSFPPSFIPLDSGIPEIRARFLLLLTQQSLEADSPAIPEVKAGSSILTGASLKMSLGLPNPYPCHHLPVGLLTGHA